MNFNELKNPLARNLYFMYRRENNSITDLDFEKLVLNNKLTQEDVDIIKGVIL